MKETFYFSHDYGARNDPRLVSIRFSIGVEAIGAYWCLMETLYEQGGMLEERFVEESIRSYGVYHTDVERLISKLFEVCLLVKQDDFVTSKSVQERIKKRLEKSEKARESVLTRYKNYERNTNVERTNTIKVKESKVKERKDNIGRFTPPTLHEVENYISTMRYDVDGLKFWNFYESKGWMVGKNKMKDWKAAIRTWLPKKEKLTNEQQMEKDARHCVSLCNGDTDQATYKFSTLSGKYTEGRIYNENDILKMKHIFKL